ncbi:MAG: GTP-binding protein [Pseudodonghicola sp.]
MTVPVLLVTGFLGVGKTTLINSLLESGIRRIAAIVNDFGAINIDAEILEGKAEAMIGLGNGCICCSLQGDLLRSLKQVLAREPEAIVIEASGVSDPRGILETLSDPVLWNAVRLDAILCVVDAEALAEDPARFEDPLWQAQVRTSDFVVLSKTAAADPQGLAALRAQISAAYRLKTFDADRDGVPMNLIFLDTPVTRAPLVPERVRAADRFTSLEWTAPGRLPFAGFQRLIEELGPVLLRAKGVVALAEREGALLFQMVGRRAGFEPAKDAAPGCRLVMIGEGQTFEPDSIRRRLDTLVADTTHSAPITKGPAR